MTIEDFKPLIESMAHKYCPNYDEYEDYVQEGYLTVIKLFDRLKERGETNPDEILKLRAGVWIRNRFLDMRKKFIPIPIDDETLIKQESLGDIDIAITNIATGLSERQKKVFGYLLAGFTDADIAKTMELSPRTIATEKAAIKEAIRDAQSQ